MKKFTFCAWLILVSALVFAEDDREIAYQQEQNTQMPSCSQLTPAEQNFAAQVIDMNNKEAFCSQFTAAQRRQAMQMMGQPDGSGNRMTADQAIQQVMSTTVPPANKTRPRTGGCPVK